MAPRDPVGLRHVSPWSDEQAARVALWTTGLRPASRRNRMRAALALALGSGLRRRDLVLVTAAHVARTPTASR